MANFRILFFLLSSLNVSASAFLTTSMTSAPKNIQSQQRPRIILHGAFEQLPGENTTDFIKRITNESNELLNQQKTNDGASNSEKITGDDDSKPVGKYQRIEEWDAERTEKGELSWEEKVQFEGQKYGNQVKQDSILRRHLGTF